MKKTLAVAVLVTALAATPAHAIITDGSAQTYCFTGGGFTSCASVSAQVLGTGDFEVIIENLAGYDDYALRAFGFYYFGTPSGSTLGAFTDGTPTQLSPSLGSWTSGINNILESPGPTGAEVWLGGAYTDPPGRPTGTAGRFVFDFDGLLPTQLYFAFRGQDAFTDGEGSFHCYESGGSTGGLEGNFTDAMCNPPTVVPEPATMALLATGLVGLGGAGLIRRRRNNV